ncbi:MAG: FadR family transcriptional regulator [Deltaproteobacteria bacterium]|nr:FadR family transcriptional regulator [Deltaproteobacteria bacterium]
MFKIARTSTITQKIIDQIRTAILAGKLKPGDVLPPEKELTEQFGVSKQTLRESLRALEHMGLIDVRKGIGGGAHIVEVDIEVTKQSLANFLYFKDLTIENLSELRKLIEPHAAAKAADHISKDDLQKLDQLNQTARDNLNNNLLAEMSHDEINFHRVIAQNTGNPILILILDFVENLLEDFKKVLKPDMAFSKSVLDAHDKIYQAICDKDPKKASTEMYQHVYDVELHLAKLKQDVDLWQGCLKTGS